MDQIVWNILNWCISALSDQKRSYEGAGAEHRQNNRLRDPRLRRGIDGAGRPPLVEARRAPPGIAREHQQACRYRDEQALHEADRSTLTCVCHRAPGASPAHGSLHGINIAAGQ